LDKKCRLNIKRVKSHILKPWNFGWNMVSFSLVWFSFLQYVDAYQCWLPHKAQRWNGIPIQHCGGARECSMWYGWRIRRVWHLMERSCVKCELKFYIVCKNIFEQHINEMTHVPNVLRLLKMWCLSHLCDFSEPNVIIQLNIDFHGSLSIMII